MQKRRFSRKLTAFCLALALLCTCAPFAAAQADTAYTGAVLMALNAERKNRRAVFSTDREPAQTQAEAAAAQAEDAVRRLPDGTFADPEPLTGPQALLRQAQVGDTAPQAAAEYRVGDTKRIYSHYAQTEGKSFRRVDMICTAIGEKATVWRECGTEDQYAEEDARIAEEMDKRVPQLLDFFGDKRIDTDGDGKIAVFLYKIDDDSVGGYFTTADLMDSVGRIGPVWHPLLTTSNHMDCIHVQGADGFTGIIETCLHEYQHYIEASYRFVGRNNFNALRATETFVNEGFSTGAEYLLAGVTHYASGFTYYAAPQRDLSLLHWSGVYGNYSLAFVFSQYIRTRYAALTDDLDSDIPGGSIYKTILSSRTPKNDKDTLALIADLLYPGTAYPDLRDPEARCRQLLYDFWMAVFCQESEGVHGFNGESWASRIRARDLVQEMPAGETDYPIRSGMAAFYQIATNETDTVRVTAGDDALTFCVPAQQNYTLRFDANGGEDAPPAQIMRESCTIPHAPTRAGYSFLGWALTPDAASPQYYTGNTVRLTADTTLYALWQPSQAVVTDTSYPMRRQGRELRNDYVFTPETDGVYKLTYASAYGAWMQMVSPNGEPVEPSYERSGSGKRSVYFPLSGGTEYDLSLTWSRTPPSSGSGTFILTRQDTYYTLTYRFDHPLVAQTWSYSGETVYVIDPLDMPLMPRFLGWALTPDAETPDFSDGGEITLTQDTTLYAVCVPDAVLTTDGSRSIAPVVYGAFLYVLRPERDGMYELQWQPDGGTQTESGYAGAALYDAAGEFLLNADAETALTCALRGGETYYLYGNADTTNAVAVCKKTADRITTTLTFSVGKNACFDLTLRGKTTYTVPDYTPAALNGREFLGWEDEENWISYAPGDTITIAADRVLTAQWSNEPADSEEIARAVLYWVPNMVRALWQNVWLRIADVFTR